ncbi:trigger factor [Roseitalea porphyridii]|uniref:Trigger factor n=1 Tax=Roseitalea porphyridii TaxID=1852022 RepID=A0A4P6V013_9HYPH|nr:trigger factor [Roseitalea porphyridii]QBK30652.1 trigger factor [Roseitalea porphyridii]
MQVTETVNEGLKREIKVVVPKSDLQAKLTDRLHDAKGKVRLNGFRPGKVPVSHLRKMYGKSFMAEIVNEILSETPRSILAEREEKSATQPEVDMTEDEGEAEKVLTGESDFEFSLKYEVIPPIESKDFSSIAITRPVVEISDEEVEEQVKRVAQSAAEYSEKKGKAADGDRVTIDYVGKLDGEPFEGGADEGAQLVLGSGTFIPGFEEQLVGAKAGDETQVTVTFPEDYQAAHLAGKEAVFDVKVTLVEKAAPVEIDDDLAQKLGLENAERLRSVVREQIEGQYAGMTRQKVKRQLLDALDEMYQIDSPEKLVETEFNNIWAQITAELEQAGRTFEDEETTEEEAREEYRKLAERRVRLGLVLSHIGEEAGVEVTETELQQAVMRHVQQYPGQERQVYEFFQKTPDAVANLRAPIFEEKTVDHLLAVANVTDETVSKEELMAEDEEDDIVPAKKEAKKKAAPKKKAPAKKKKADDAPAEAEADKAE